MEEVGDRMIGTGSKSRRPREKIYKMPSKAMAWMLICSEACMSLIASCAGDILTRSLRKGKDLEEACVIGKPAEI